MQLYNSIFVGEQFIPFRTKDEYYDYCWGEWEYTKEVYKVFLRTRNEKTRERARQMILEKRIEFAKKMGKM